MHRNEVMTSTMDTDLRDPLGVIAQAEHAARPAFVDIDRASLTYADDGAGVLALKQASMKIAKGEFIAVVGPSGCGKSTLLKLVSGLRRPTEGGVMVAGKEVSGPLKIVGMAFQNPILLPWRNAIDNVLLPLEIVQPYRSRFRRDKAAFVERAKGLFKTVGLQGFENKFPWQLSGGMQQRVSLCRALIHEPDLLLLDEPFGALDTFTREELWEVMQALWMDRGFTVILVTHDLVEATFLADTVYVISSRPGQIIHNATVPFARPRQFDDRYKPGFTEMVHDLRERIGRARQAS
jgi:NitT/TauT family transport system ATP-binding protein